MVTRLINIFLALSLAAAIGVVVVSAGRQNPGQADPRAVQAALREGGLRAAAKASGGHYEATTGWISEIAHTLDSLVGQSDVVLIGDLLENRGHLSASGEYITTDYRMRVHRRLKGDALPGSDVVFGVMGGKVVFEDGSSALLGTTGFIRPNTGARVVIFATRFSMDDPLMPPALRSYANGAPVFRLVGMGRGVIELPANENDRVRMNAVGASDPAARSMRSKSVRQFLLELEKVVRKSAA
jgi:hypothetical protein